MREHGLAIAVISAITILFFSPLLRGRTFSMVGAHMFAQYPWTSVIRDSPEIRGRGYPQTDDAEGLYPTSVFATNAVRTGQFPMWLPYNFAGVPVMESGVGNGLLYPPQLIAMAFLSPARQHDLLLFVHLLLAGLGMYSLLRCWSVNLLGALFGALVWQFNGNNAFFLEFEFVGVAAAWFPLMLLFATLAIRRKSWRWALATGLASGMSILHGVQHWEYLGTVTAGAWYVGLAMAAARRLLRKGGIRSALFCLSLPLVSGLTAAALSAASWLSLANLVSHVHRQPYSLEAQLAQSFTLRSLVRGLVFPLSAAGPERIGAADFASFCFIGIPALLFIPAGFLRRSTPVIFAGIVGVSALAMISGAWPFFKLFRTMLPYFGALRPLDAFYLLCFASAVFAAIGISESCRRFTPGSRDRVLKGFGALLIAVESVQLIMFAWIISPQQPERSEWLFPETPLIRELRSVQGEYHVIPVLYRDPAGRWTPPVFAGKVNACFDLRSVSGYDSLLPLSTAMLWRAVERGGVVDPDIPAAYRPYFYNDRIPLGLLEQLSVGFIVTPPNTDLHDVDGSRPLDKGALELVYQGPDGWIYKVPHALPRAFLVFQAVVAPDPETSLRLLLDQRFDARQTAIVTEDGRSATTSLSSSNSLPTEIGAKANIASDRLNEVDVEVYTPRVAMLILNDSWDDGWKAEVDGVGQPIIKVNYAFRGVIVPEGRHQVTFRYRPRLLLLGVAVSGITIVALVVLCTWIGVLSVRRRYGRPIERNLHLDPALAK